MSAPTPANALDDALGSEQSDTIKALERANRILTKRLSRSERARAEIEETSEYQERMLKAALTRAERDRTELAAAKEELLKLNEELAARIEVRTAALSKATDSLKQAQVQVVKSEKFSTLGELVAGVAHEINNPIGCITSNIGFVQEYGQQMIEHIQMLNAVLNSHKQLIPSAALEDVVEHAEEIELDYIVEDFSSLILSIKTSGDRIKAISTSLRTFARADTTQKQSYNIHEGIDGTLLILRHRLKAVGTRPAIEVCKSYGQIPEITCCPGQINQVFMNILANAIDAMDEGHTSTEGKREISIETKQEGQNVVVSITDTAGGIPEQIIDHIFENQFTTKAAGKGTGLGLSIVHEIVTQHHLGQIRCTSEIGQGSTFVVTLPIDVPR